MTEQPFGSFEDLNTGEEEVDEMLADYKQLKEAKALALQQVEDKQEIKTKKSRFPLLLGLLPIFFALTVWNVARLVKTPDPVSSLEELEAVQWSIYMIVDGIETFRESTGQLPISLEALGLDDDFITYTVLGNIYSLTTKIGDRELVYHDGDDLDPFMNSYNKLMAGEIR